MKRTLLSTVVFFGLAVSLLALRTGNLFSQTWFGRQQVPLFELQLRGDLDGDEDVAAEDAIIIVEGGEF